MEWFRAKIDLKQWREEVEILDEELTRTARWFSKMGDLWRALASGSTSSKRGFSEYAYQKADMFARRSMDAQEHHRRALAVDVKKAV